MILDLPGVDIIGPSIVMTDLTTKILSGPNTQNEDLRLEVMSSVVGLAQLGGVRLSVMRTVQLISIQPRFGKQSCSKV
jgi:hypothetical protein